jgi:uncharacterized GH25 family protein
MMASNESTAQLLPKAALLTALLYLAAGPLPGALGHDLWLIPPEAPAAGAKALIQCSVGMEFPISVRAIDSKLFKRKLVLGPDGKEGSLEDAGTKETLGLMQFEPQLPGIYQIAVETQPKLITLPAEKFNEYLVEDGMPHIYQLRAKEKTLDQPGRERYQKSPKTIFQVGNGGAGDFGKVLGLPLEIVPLRNPLALKAGAALPVRVLFHRKPLAEVYVGWQHPGDGAAARGMIRTNADGEALIPIAATGLITLRLTHMTRPKTKDYEWESFWSTLTFRIPS